MNIVWVFFFRHQLYFNSRWFQMLRVSPCRHASGAAAAADSRVPADQFSLELPSRRGCKRAAVQTGADKTSRRPRSIIPRASTCPSRLHTPTAVIIHVCVYIYIYIVCVYINITQKVRRFVFGRLFHCCNNISWN